MAFPDTSKGPAHVMTELMGAEIEREKERLGIRWDAPSDRLSLGAPAPGVLYFREAYGSHKEVSFPLGMRLLADLPDRAGSLPVRRALDKAWNGSGHSPFPRNDPQWLQVGDRLGDGRVDGIAVGHGFDNAKNGQDVRSVPRAAFNTRDSSERIIVTLSGPKGGWWRRGTQIMGSLPRPAPEGRETLRRLRRDHDLIEREYHRELNAVLRDGGSAERLLAYSGMRTASLRMLGTVSHADATPERGERVHLRARLRDLRELGRALRGRGELTLRRDSPLDRAIALVAAESRDLGARFDRVCRTLKADRAPRAPAP